MKIYVETIVKPTEDLEKVKKAILNVFKGEIRVIDKGNGYYKIEGFSTDKSSLEKIYNLIRIHQIISAARNYFFKGLRGNTISFMLHKQAAFMNKISFIDSEKESPLGAIKFIIETDDPRKLIDWLAPVIGRRTRNK